MKSRNKNNKYKYIKLENRYCDKCGSDIFRRIDIINVGAPIIDRCIECGTRYTNITTQIKKFNNKGYKVFTRDKFVEYMLSTNKASCINKNYIKQLNEMWEKLSKDYNFIIAVGQESELMLYSVDYFNNEIIKEPKEDNKKVNNIGITLKLNAEKAYKDIAEAIRRNLSMYID